MKKSILLFTTAALFSFAAFTVADDHSEVISKVMKEGFKGDDSLMNQATKGKTSPKQTKELAALVKKLHGTKAPEGDQSDYEEKIAELIAAMDAVAGGDTGADAVGRLKEAANCKACHSKHKP